MLPATFDPSGLILLRVVPHPPPLRAIRAKSSFVLYIPSIVSGKSTTKQAHNPPVDFPALTKQGEFGTT